jgi:hypothetical protein
MTTTLTTPDVDVTTINDLDFDAELPCELWHGNIFGWRRCEEISTWVAELKPHCPRPANATVLLCERHYTLLIGGQVAVCDQCAEDFVMRDRVVRLERIKP